MNISAEKLVVLRKERGWSQEKLAAMAGVSERTIQRAEGEGNCSLDTKMALASVFEISPSELQQDTEVFDKKKVDYKISWSGILGLLLLGLIAPLIVLLTATNGTWEVICMFVVWGLTITFTTMNYGFRATYKLFDNTSWIVKYPTYVSGLSTYIIQAKSAIEYSYMVGLVATLVSGLTIAVHVPTDTTNHISYITYSIRPFIYSILFVELWFRPFKKRMETMLADQMKLVGDT